MATCERLRSQIITARLALEPIGIAHADELHALLADPDLHRFTDSGPPTLDEICLRCARWETGRSPDGREQWWNWAGRARDDQGLVGHFQLGVIGGVATLGYTVARARQRRGFAREALAAVLARLPVDVRLIEASIDPANVASIGLIEGLGLERVAGVELWRRAL